MRAEVEIGGASAGGWPEAGRLGTPASAPPGRRRRLDGFELAVLGVFAALSVWVLGLDLFQVIAHGRVWTGTDGIYVVDQMQYLAWIREASRHVLVSNLFVLRSTPADYFQPAIALSGALSAIGIAPWLTLLLWKPVAVGATFVAVRRYVARTIPGLWPRRAALVLALFFGSFTSVYGSFGVVGDLQLGFLSWGYTFGLLSIAAVVLALLSYERVRAGAPARAALWKPALLGALASSLHPWHGELLVMIVVGGELLLWACNRSRPALTAAGVTVAATIAPLLYYAILGHVDLSWQLARDASKHAFSLPTILIALAPLLVVALLSYRERSRTFLAAATRAWPVAALVVYGLSASELSATPLHAFQGVTIPLAILAVQGAQAVRFVRLPGARAAGAIAVALITVPGTFWLLRTAEQAVTPSSGNPNFVNADEHRALEYLDADRDRGGVLTLYHLGQVVPALTGRRTFVGDCLWSEPGCNSRVQLAMRIFTATISPAATERIVAATGARFVLADCTSSPRLARTIGRFAASVHHFGCASVYELASPSPPTGPLAESPANAALRATGRQQRRSQQF